MPAVGLIGLRAFVLDTVAFGSYLVQSKILSQVNLLNFEITSKLTWGAIAKDSPLVYYISPVGYIQSFSNVVIGNQDPDSTFSQLGNDALNVPHGQRVYSRKRFIQKDKLRRQDKRARDLEPSSLASGQRVRSLAPQVADSKLLQQLRHHLFLPVLCERETFRNATEILLNGEFSKHRRLLWQIAYAGPGPHIHRKLRDFFAVEENPSRIRRDEADDNIERRGLSRPIGPKQSNHFPLTEKQIDIAEYLSASVGLAQVCRLQGG